MLVPEQEASLSDYRTVGTITCHVAKPIAVIALRPATTYVGGLSSIVHDLSLTRGAAGYLFRFVACQYFLPSTFLFISELAVDCRAR